MKRTYGLLFFAFMTAFAANGCGKKASKANAETPRELGPKDQEKPPVDQENPQQEPPADIPDDEKPAEPAPGGVVDVPPGVPAGGTIFERPIPAATMTVNLGTDWVLGLPPGYHLLTYASNQTLQGPSTIELGQIMNDPLSPSPVCNGSDTGNSLIVSMMDGSGVPHAYCLSYFNSVSQFRGTAGADRGVNSVEFSSSAKSVATYERFYFATFDEVTTPDDEMTPPLTRFNALCRKNYNRGEVPMDIVNNWWNDPLKQRPVKVQWCQTLLGGVYGKPLEVWVAGFLFNERDGASNNASHLKIEMTYIVSAAGVPGSFRPDVFLKGTAFRIRAMLQQTGLNAPFNEFVP